MEAEAARGLWGGAELVLVEVASAGQARRGRETGGRRAGRCGVVVWLRAIVVRPMGQGEGAAHQAHSSEAGELHCVDVVRSEGRVNRIKRCD